MSAPALPPPKKKKKKNMKKKKLEGGDSLQDEPQSGRKHEAVIVGIGAGETGAHGALGCAGQVSERRPRGSAGGVLWTVNVLGGADAGAGDLGNDYRYDNQETAHQPSRAERLARIHGKLQTQQNRRADKNHDDGDDTGTTTAAATTTTTKNNNNNTEASHSTLEHSEIELMTFTRDDNGASSRSVNTRPSGNTADAALAGHSPAPTTTPTCRDVLCGLCVPFALLVAGVMWVLFVSQETNGDLLALDCDRLRFFSPVVFAYLLGYLFVAVSFRPQRQQQDNHETILVAFKHRAAFSSLCLLLMCTYLYSTAAIGYPQNLCADCACGACRSDLHSLPSKSGAAASKDQVMPMGDACSARETQPQKMIRIWTLRATAQE